MKCLLFPVLPILTLFVAVALSHAEIAEDDWPVFRGNAESTGVATGELPKELKLLWRFRGDDNAAFESTPVIVDGVVYIGDLDGRFYAIDLAGGNEKWRRNFETGFTAAAAGSNGKIYIGDIDGDFYCLDAENGNTLWQFETQGEISAGANFHGDRVLVGSQDATLYCLTAEEGKEVWKFTIGDQIRCAPTVVQDRAFVAGCDSKLHIVDLTTGKSVGAVAIDSPTGATPAAQGSVVYFGTEGGTMFAIDWQKAEVIWRHNDPNRPQAIRSSAAAAPETIVWGSRSRRIVAANAASGEERWIFPTRARVDSSPVVVENRVFIGSDDGKLFALDLESGKLLWQYETGTAITGAPAVTAGRLVVANKDGVVFCFGAEKR